MGPEIDPSGDEDTKSMLGHVGKSPQVVPASENQRHRKESLRDFLKSLGSVSSLPGQHGKPFSTRKGVLHQCIASFAVLMLSASCGQPIGFSAVLLPQLYQENTTMHIDLEMGSWLASVHSAATPFGSLLAGPLMEHCGRLRTLQFSVLPLVAGWVIMAAAPSLTVLMVGRFFCGYGVGSFAASGQVYLGEIADPKLRGLLSGTPFVSYSLGILIVYAVGDFPWRWVSASGVVLPIVSILLMVQLPKSPDWLARHGHLTQAHNAIVWLRGDDSLARKEIHQILTASAKERDEQARTNDSFFTIIKRLPVIKPLIIINVFNLLQTLSGTYIVVFYAVDIIEDVAGNNVNSLLAAIYTAVIRLIFSIIGCFLLYRINRRTICVFSGIGSAIASFVLGIFILCRLETPKTSLDFWVASASITIYIASNTLGFMMLPGLMVGELLPAKVRGMCGGYIFTIFNIGLFTFSKLFPIMKHGIGTHGMFIIFGIASFAGTLFMYLLLPETKNKSLLEIERYFENSGFIWRKPRESSSPQSE